MNLSRIIPASLHAATLAQLAAQNPETGKPFTSREVAAWLFAEHQVKCSHMAVLRLFAAADAQGEQRIVAALREEVRDAVQPALKRLVRGCKALDGAIAGEKNAAKIAAGVRALTGALDSVAKLGGVAAPVKIDVTSGGQALPDAHALLAARLASLSQEPDALGAGLAPGESPTRNG